MSGVVACGHDVLGRNVLLGPSRTVLDALRSSLDDVIRAAPDPLHIHVAEVSFVDSACAWEIRRARSVLDATGRAWPCPGPRRRSSWSAPWVGATA